MLWNKAVFCLEVVINKRLQMWRHNDVIGRNEYLIFILIPKLVHNSNRLLPVHPLTFQRDAHHRIELTELSRPHQKTSVTSDGQIHWATVSIIRQQWHRPVTNSSCRLQPKWSIDEIFQHSACTACDDRKDELLKHITVHHHPLQRL